MQRGFFRIYMPYVIEKVDRLDSNWVVMNRDYAPLGYHDSPQLKWELFPQGYLQFKKINKDQLKRLEKAGAIIRYDDKTGEAIRIVLYNDGTAPINRDDLEFDKSKWETYCKLLSILATTIPNDKKYERRKN